MSSRLPADKRSGKHILEYILSQLVELKKQSAVSSSFTLSHLFNCNAVHSHVQHLDLQYCTVRSLLRSIVHTVLTYSIVHVQVLSNVRVLLLISLLYTVVYVFRETLAIWEPRQVSVAPTSNSAVTVDNSLLSTTIIE